MGNRSTEAFSRVVIDGYNLINRVPVLASRLAASGLEGARSYLLGWLRRYQEVRRRRVILVLDGPRSSRSDFGPVEVHYSPGADDAVVRWAGPGSLVVTSDQAVASESRLAGAIVLDSEDFWRAMTANTAPRRGRSDSPGEADMEGLGRARQARPPHRRPKRLTKREKRRRREHEELLRRV